MHRFYQSQKHLSSVCNNIKRIIARPYHSLVLFETTISLAVLSAASASFCRLSISRSRVWSVLLISSTWVSNKTSPLLVFLLQKYIIKIDKTTGNRTLGFKNSIKNVFTFCLLFTGFASISCGISAWSSSSPISPSVFAGKKIKRVGKFQHVSPEEKIWSKMLLNPLPDTYSMHF